jgi:hypothetical protein
VKDEEFDADRAVKILGHPVRIRIIELLAARGPLSWKELSKEVGTSTGALYHHIDVLERIVTRDSAKRYVLTGLGVRIHDYMNAKMPTRDYKALGQLMGKRSRTFALQGLLIPRALISLLTSSRPRALASSAGISTLVFASMVVSRSQVFLLAFLPSHDLLLSVTSLGMSLLAMTGVVYVETRLAGSRADPTVLLGSVALSLFPLAAFSLSLGGLVTTGSLGMLADKNVLTFAFAIFQGWGACIVAAGVSVATGMRVEKALLLSLILPYVTILVVFAQGLNFI